MLSSRFKLLNFDIDDYAVKHITKYLYFYIKYNLLHYPDKFTQKRVFLQKNFDTR